MVGFTDFNRALGVTALAIAPRQSLELWLATMPQGSDCRFCWRGQLGAPYFSPLTVGGQPIDLSHLEPFTIIVDSQLAMKKLRVRISFTTHCFSEEFGKILHPPGDPVIDQSTNRPRTFCPIRHQLSKQLPALLRSLTDEDVYQTSAVRNWVFSVTVASPNGPYHIFFEVKRSPNNQRTWQDLNLTVESAYPESDGPPSVRGKKPFVLVCGETYTGNKRPPLRR